MNKEARKYIKDTIKELQSSIKKSGKNNVVIINAEDVCKMLVEIQGLID